MSMTLRQMFRYDTERVRLQAQEDLRAVSVSLAGAVPAATRRAFVGDLEAQALGREGADAGPRDGRRVIRADQIGQFLRATRGASRSRPG